MKPWKVVSLILFVLAIAAAVYGLILVQHGFSALATPSAIEELAATTARKLALPSAYRQLRNPITPSTESVGEAWNISPIIAPRAIEMTEGARRYTAGVSIRNRPTCAAAGTQHKSDGELYYTIENGVRLSGMPAFHGTHTVPQTWRLVLFIRHLPQITPEELNEMKGWNSKMEADPAHV